MVILHGSWVNNITGKGCFHLWAESSGKASGREKISARAGTDTHPFALSASEMKSLLKAMDFAGLYGVRMKQMDILLPTANNIPRVSSRLVSADYYEGEGDVKLSKWKIACARMPAFECFIWFLRHPEDADKTNPEVVFSKDLLYWVRASKFILELVARERFVPSIVERGNKVFGVWKPVLTDESDLERFNVLVESMPPVCRSIEEASFGREVSAREVVSGFLTMFLDNALRTWIDKREYEYLEDKCYYRNDVFSLWIESVCSDSNEVRASGHQKRILLEHLVPWVEVLHAVDKEFSWLTCFKLEAPEEGGDLWNLSFHLQSANDRSLIIPLEWVWENDERLKGVVKDDIGKIQERVIGDIARASRLFSPIEKSLEEKTPVCCRVSTDEAYRFLNEGASLMEESGYNVIIPGWWLNRKRKLGLRLKMKPNRGKTGETGSGFFSMNSLINFDWEVALGKERLSREEFEKIARLKVPLIKFRGEWIEVNRDNIQKLQKIINNVESKGVNFSEALRMKLSGREQDVDIIECRFVDWLDRIITGEERFNNIDVTSGFNGKLRPYQEKGFSWLNYITGKGFGVCLADDMGLGKTIQFLALIIYHKEKNSVKKPVLLLCPTSIVGNWEREVQRFTPGLKFMVHHGVKRLSGSEFVEAAEKQDLVISTYSLGLRDKDTMALVDWHGTVLDEAQGIKNPLALQTRAIREIAKGYRVALTGTPVENHLSELWSIMEFLNPGYLGSFGEFRRNYAIPVERYNNEVALERLKKIIQPFILRRMKTDRSIIRDLPRKFETKIYCNMSREQATLYKAVVNDMINNIDDSEGIQRRGIILASLIKLKQICNHPALFLKDQSSAGERSEKLKRLVQMAEEILSGGNRMLIFTQFVGMGHILQEHLQSHFGREVLFLHGGLKRKARDSMVSRFQDENDGPPVFILSTRAGGFGLNLTRANYVFHFDRWWNPAVENQATDRAYRIGQESNVVVYKFICSGTLEEKIDEMLEHKKGLADNIIGSGESWLAGLSNEKLREVFTMNEGSLLNDEPGGID